MITFNDVSFQYADGRGVSNLNFHIAKGECVVFTGASGCGKTTVTRLINGLAPYFYPGERSGSINIMGRTGERLRPEELAGCVGSVFQNPRSQFFNLDTDSEVAFTAENLAMPPEKIKHGMAHTIESLGIERLMGRDILTLSGGEKQLVAIASVMTPEPEIFVLDEPSANLDIDSIKELKKAIGRLKRMGKTVVVAEHRLYYLADVADRFIRMEKGKITHRWSAGEFAALPQEGLQELGLRTPHLERLRPVCCGQAAGADHALKIEKLTFSYRKEKPVIDGVNGTLRAGEIVGLIGRNGQGKSTLARLLCGLERQKSGTIEWNGKRLSARQRRSCAYLVMQEPGYQLFSESVEQEMRMTAALPTDERVGRTLAFLQLGESAEKHPMSLSGGEKQRLSIGVAMMQDRDVLLMDEPTSGLDYANMQRVGELTETLRRQGKLIVIISHDYAFLLQTCTRILQMESGRIFRDYALNDTNLHFLRDYFVPGEEKT